MTWNVGQIDGSYAAELTALLNVAYDSVCGPLAEPAEPSGFIHMRCARMEQSASAQIIDLPRSVDSPDRLKDAIRYWSAALPARMFAPAVLVRLASEYRSDHLVRTLERQILQSYRLYHCSPLSEPLVKLIGATVSEQPALESWVEEAMNLIGDADSIDDAFLWRVMLRTDAVAAGAHGIWNERSVAVAEFVTDVAVLLRACKEDLDAAQYLAARDSTPVARAAAVRDAAAGTYFQRAFDQLLQPVLTINDFDEKIRSNVIAFAASRTAHGFAEQLVRGSFESWEKDRAAVHHPTRASNQPDVSPADEYRRLRAALTQEILGQDEVCSQLALVGLAHRFGLRGQRVLIVGRSGAGKTHAARVLARTMGVPYFQVDANDLTKTGFRGVDISAAVRMLVAKDRNPDRNRGVLLIDEVDKLRIEQGSDVVAEAQYGAQTSLLTLLGGQPVTADGWSEEEQFDTSGLLVIGTGAFDGRFTDGLRPPSTDDLVAFGFLEEFAARWAERCCLKNPDRAGAVQLLRLSELSVERTLRPLLQALGISLSVSDAAVAYAAEMWLAQGAELRSAAQWLLAAARRRLTEALDRADMTPIEIVPDDLHVPDRHRRSQ